MDTKDESLPVFVPKTKGDFEVIHAVNPFKIPPRNPRKVDDIRGLNVRLWRRS